MPIPFESNTDEPSYVNLANDTHIIAVADADQSLEDRCIAIGVEAKRLGITKITMLYYGGGDSGQLEHIDIQPREIQISNAFHKTLEEFGDDYMENSGIDWYNNEGGSGTLVWDVAAGEFDGEVTWNEIVSNTGYSNAVSLFGDTAPVSDADAASDVANLAKAHLDAGNAVIAAAGSLSSTSA